MEEKGLNIGLVNTAVALITTILVVYILIIGKALLLPLLTAIVIWYLIIRLTAAFSVVPFTQQSIPYGVAMLFAFIATGLVLWGFVNLITHSINGVISDAPKYQEKLNDLFNWGSQLVGAKYNFDEILKRVNLTKIFSDAALTVTYIMGNLVLILIYVLFLLLEYKTFHVKLHAMAKTKKQYNFTDKIIEQISGDINTYMKVKTWMSLMTGVCSYLVLVVFGVHYAQFWALLIFLLNYVPTIGSIVAVGLTLLAVSIQFDTVGTFIFMATVLIAIQFIIGNVIEPKFMGSNLNLSPLVILLGLAFWGAIWGVLGMLLCIPLMTILNIILSKFDGTRFIAIGLSSNPDVLNTR